jgi:hypothetical protein
VGAARRQTPRELLRMAQRDFAGATLELMYFAAVLTAAMSPEFTKSQRETVGSSPIAQTM